MIPQELLDAIIDEIHLFDDAYPFESIHSSSETNVLVQTLRACTLASRALVRPAQGQLFAVVRVQYAGSDRSCFRFAQLLQDSPHISIYVNHLHVLYAWRKDATSLGAVLRALVKLKTLELVPGGEVQQWSAHPYLVQGALAVALSRPSLRCLSMFHYEFHEVSELHRLLQNAVGLKHLRLSNPTCLSPDSEHVRVAEIPPPTVLLDSLELRNFTPPDVDRIMRVFTSIDMSHLRSLHLTNSAAAALLHENARTLRKVEIYIESSTSQFDPCWSPSTSYINSAIQINFSSRPSILTSWSVQTTWRPLWSMSATPTTWKVSSPVLEISLTYRRSEA